ncbi:hypothetical protein N0V94_004092 [Neodidymelliopsis sp. IMI 364377]|nr:hypothetical protein N0V94_004092 [Neodidymelliopsis sp. IMI 364377]
MALPVETHTQLFKMPLHRLINTLSMISIFFPSLSNADCECGYRISYRGNSSAQARTLFFTDAVQVNFRTLSTLEDSHDWKIKTYRREYVPNSDRYGKLVEAKNIVPNPLQNTSAGWSSPSLQGANVAAGLQLIVRAALTPENLVSTAQIESVRDDIRFGSFRAYVKSTPVNGTCAASFWYHNDSSEIDMELLSQRQLNPSFPINLSVHSDASVENGFDARNTLGFIDGQLERDPAEGFHEYRYDWSPDVVSFYTDGRWLGDIDAFVPKEQGIFQLSHWSDGNSNFTGRPPERDAVVTVAYFEAYFNSSSQTQFGEYCGGWKRGGSVCEVGEFEENYDEVGGPRFVGGA